MRGASERIDRDRRLLALELVYRTYPSLGQAKLDLEHLRVVRGDNQYVGDPNGLFITFAIDPGCALC